jgi:hypothetical protein
MQHGEGHSRHHDVVGSVGNRGLKTYYIYFLRLNILHVVLEEGVHEVMLICIM